MSTPLDGWIAVLPNRCSLAGICRHVTQEATTTWPPFQRTQHASRQLQAMKKETWKQSQIKTNRVPADTETKAVEKSVKHEQIEMD